MTAVSTKMIKSARRVLEVLEYFDQDYPTATVMDIARSLGYPQSSTSELLRCLVMLGYLRYDRYRRTYNPTARVALIGAWVEPDLFREGALLPTIDMIAETTGQTVVLSTAANYQVQHIHVTHGSSEDRVSVHVSETEPLLHSARGRLLLSTYQQPQIRSAIHRLNAEESDPQRIVRLADMMQELATLRSRGWAVEAGPEGGAGLVAVMLPPRPGGQRIALSVVAPSAMIEARADEFRKTIESTGLCPPPPREVPASPVRTEAEVRGIRPPAPPQTATLAAVQASMGLDRVRRSGEFVSAANRATGRYLALT